MTADLPQRVTQEFEKRFGSRPAFVARGPGRVNLIGEHTDYNDGFVLPMAIDRAAWIALRPRDDDRVLVHSLDFAETSEFSLKNLTHEKKGWLEYLKGTAWTLQNTGHTLRGWEGVLAGDVPIGSGLSSSAALEMATARAFAAVSDFVWDSVAMGKVGQQTENKWIGVNCGIMDPLISASGQSGHAMLIDCRSLETRSVPVPPQTEIVVLDTTTRRGLVDSAYNERRAQCQQAAQLFGVPALRDVTILQFQARSFELDDVPRRRARHVISENERTLRAANVMERGDAAALGKLMNESHTSLRTDFEVSSKELDAIVACARAVKGCYGARMTGAGFGGCAVALVREEATLGFVKDIAVAYQKATGLQPNIYVCQASNGAEILSPS